MNPKTRKILVILLTPFLLGFLFGFLVGGGCSRKEKKAAPEVVEQVVEEQQEEAGETAPAEEEEVVEDDVDGTGVSQAREIIYYTKLMSYGKVFDDVNETHLEKAKAVGLKKIPEKRSDVDASQLVKVEDTDYLMLDEKMRYSVPYLTAGAARELNHIAKAFNDSLVRKQFPVYRLVVTSILRTEEDVTRLRKSGNPNASDNSSHCYGVSFDISHSRYFREEETDEFMQPYELTKVLAEVLRDEKNAGRILVKYEKKEHCFHITSCQ